MSKPDKHTPGPWFLDSADDDDGNFSMYHYEIKYQAPLPYNAIAYLQMPSNARPQNYRGKGSTDSQRDAATQAYRRAMADLRLMSVAPELLEALKELSAGMWAGDGVTTPRVPGDQVAKARSIIDKAEGK